MRLILLAIFFYLFYKTQTGMKGKITKNFTWEEFERTSKPFPNQVPVSKQQNVVYLMIEQLQPFRDRIAEPIIITSGYRSFLVNQAVGGSPDSQHREGLAVDHYCPTIEIEEYFRLFLTAGLPYDQAIIEQGKHGERWVHTSLSRAGANRFQAMRATFDHSTNKMNYQPYYV